MTRKVIVLITTLILVVAMTSVTSFAATKGTVNYSTTTSQVLYSCSSSYGAVYGRLKPAPLSPAAKLQLWNGAGTNLMDEETYFAYPPNSNVVSGPANSGEYFEVKPVGTNVYIWGSGDFWET
ncbi:MAG: hypothetical protein J5752_00035 [Clostridiales bacterium]|nr:hypothetical protein [Clostridiales bacterium]